MQNKRAHADEGKKQMDEDLATKLKERSRKVDEVNNIIGINDFSTLSGR